MGASIGFGGLACSEAADQLSHKADALKVIFQTDVLVGSVQIGPGMAHASREGRYAQGLREKIHGTATGHQRVDHRFLANTRVKVHAYYDGLIRAALAGWAGRTIYLVIDTTSLAGRLVICRISVIYRGRAVPLAWRVYQRKSVMLAFEDYKDLLEHVPTLLPERVRVVRIGDRGFRTTEIMAWCDEHPGWHFRLRLKGNQEVTLPDGRVTPLADVRLRPGMVRFLHGVLLGQKGYGPIDIAMAWAKTPDAEPWYIATDERADQHTLTEYRWRVDMEEGILDDKSGGFQLEDCELPDAESVSRLLLVMAVACLYVVSLGTFVVETDQRHTVDAHWGRGLSYFQIGWRWLRRLIYQGDAIPSLFCLSPDPDPDPVPLPKARRNPLVHRAVTYPKRTIIAHLSKC